MPPKAAVRERAADRGMQVLEEKLSILTQGPSRTRRNPALDVLTGRVPDERVQLLQANLLNARVAAEQGAIPDPADVAGETSPIAPARPAAPTAMVVPVAAVRMAAVARSSRPAPSPWLRAAADSRPRLRLVTPQPSRWARIPWLGRLLLRFSAPLYGGASTV